MTLLALPNPAPTVQRMADLGVLEQVLPEAQVAGLETLTAYEAALGVGPDGLRRLAALLPPDPPLTEQVAARLRLSVAQRKRLTLAAARDGGVLDARVLAYRLGMTEARDRLLLAGQSVATLDRWDVPTFPLKGGAIVARGITAGPEVARLLRTVESRWVAEGFPDEGRVSALLDEALAEG